MENGSFDASNIYSCLREIPAKTLTNCTINITNNYYDKSDQDMSDYAIAEKYIQEHPPKPEQTSKEYFKEYRLVISVDVGELEILLEEAGYEKKKTKNGNSWLKI
jgi:hypothetical protein